MTNQFLFNRLNNIFPYSGILNISKLIEFLHSFLKDYKDFYPNNPKLYLSIKMRGLDEGRRQIMKKLILLVKNYLSI